MHNNGIHQIPKALRLLVQVIPGVIGRLDINIVTFSKYLSIIMNTPNVSCIRPAYEEFHRQIAKAFLVATGENTEYKSGRFSNFQKEIDEIIQEYGERNIFMSVGISMLISSLEVYLKAIFLCLAKANLDSRSRILDIIGNEVDANIPLETLVTSNRNKFNFQNLKYTSKNFKRVFELDLKQVFDNEKRERGFHHPDADVEKFIEQRGVYDYLIEPNYGGLILRHKVIHQSYTPEEAKSIFLMLYEIHKYFSTSLVEEIYDVNFDEIPK